jgi:hypothetical protein
LELAGRVRVAHVVNKIANLTDWLTRAVPGLAQDPERLFVIHEKGNVVARSGGPSFIQKFTAQIIVLDVPYAHLDAVIVALVIWLQRQQPELMENSESAENAIPYQLVELDRETCDFRCDLQLTELVSVLPRDGGGFDVLHRDEPDRDPNFPGLAGVMPPVRLLQLYLKDDLVIEAPLP